MKTIKNFEDLMETSTTKPSAVKPANLTPLPNTVTFVDDNVYVDIDIEEFKKRIEKLEKEYPDTYLSTDISY